MSMLEEVELDGSRRPKGPKQPVTVKGAPSPEALMLKNFGAPTSGDPQANTRKNPTVKKFADEVKAAMEGEKAPGASSYHQVGVEMNPQGQVIYPKPKELDIETYDDGFKLEVHGLEVHNWDDWWASMGVMFKSKVKVSGL